MYLHDGIQQITFHISVTNMSKPVTYTHHATTRYENARESYTAVLNSQN